MVIAVINNSDTNRNNKNYIIIVIIIIIVIVVYSNHHNNSTLRAIVPAILVHCVRLSLDPVVTHLPPKGCPISRAMVYDIELIEKIKSWPEDLYGSGQGESLV